MLIDNISNEKIQHILILCKPNETEIAELYEAYDRNVDGNFPTTDEITFKIPYMITENGRTFHNPNYDLIEGDYLIKYIQKLDGITVYEKFFIISNPRDNSNETDFKEVHGYSREHELNKKLIRNYTFTSRSLFSLINEKDSNGEMRGVINYLTTLTSWSFDTSSIPASLLTKFRSFDVSELTFLSFLVEEVQSAFGCIFLFDTINKRISVKEVENLGGHNGLYISEQNYLKTINKEMKHDDIVTRLYVFGKDGLSINSLNPTGETYIENFSFYKQPKFMSQGLIDALNIYENLLSHHKNNNTFENLLTQLRTLQNEKLQFETELIALKNQLVLIQDNIDSRIKLGQDYSDLNTQEISKQNEINTKITQVNGKQTQIDNKIAEISNFNDLIKKENNFTPEQIKELDYYVREKVWIDNSYETVEELFEEANNKLATLCAPPMQFDIEMVDFLNIAEGKLDRCKFTTGSIVTVGFPKFNIDVDVRFVGYSYGLDSNSLKMRFSNTNSIDDPYILLSELQKNAITTSTSIDMSKFKWDKSANNESLIQQIINGELETSAKRVVAAKDQGVMINDRGIWLTEKDEFGNAKPEMMRIINNRLVLSTDSFKTASLAISPQGIIADKLIGRVIAGTNLIIDASDNQGNKTFTVDSLGVRIKGTALTIEGGLPPSQLDPTFKDSLVELNKNYSNGIRIDTTNGLVVTRSDDKIRSTFNATDGIKIETKVGSTWRNSFYFDPLTSNLVVDGEINARAMKINGQNVLTGDGAKFNGQFIDKIKIGQLDTSEAKITTAMIENLVVGSNVTLGSNVTISYATQVTDKPFIPTVPSYITSTQITSTTISSPTIHGGTITIGSGNYVFKADTNGIYLGNSMFSNAPFRVNTSGAVTASNINITGGSINVSTDVYIGNKLHINKNNFGNGIRWGTSLGDPEIYIDPISSAIFIEANAVYANNQRIDVAPVAKFG